MKKLHALIDKLQLVHSDEKPEIIRQIREQMEVVKLNQTKKIQV